LKTNIIFENHPKTRISTKYFVSDCPKCGKRFKKLYRQMVTKIRQGQRKFYCDRSCGSSGGAEKKEPAKIFEFTCAHCGKRDSRPKHYVTTKLNEGKTDFYCSRSCQMKSRYKKKKGVKNEEKNNNE